MDIAFLKNIKATDFDFFLILFLNSNNLKEIELQYFNFIYKSGAIAPDTIGMNG